jgi:hypothetical protein
MNAASPVLELLADPHAAAARSLDELAETLLRRAAEPRAEVSVALADLPDPHARSLFRSLLACLARKSAQEAGTALDPYGGTLAFVRDTPDGPVRIDGTFDNRAGTARLTLPPPRPHPDGRPPHARGGSAVVDALHTAVVDYWIDDIAFSLASDLDRLDRVRAAGAAESAVLYCNRIVEAMARRTVGPAARSATPSLAGLINDLVKYHHLPQPLKRLLHALRELGNDARHAVQPVTAAEVDVAFAVLLRWLQWAFCESASGPRLPALNRPNGRADALLPRGLARLVEAAAAGEEVLAQLTAEHAAGGALLTPLLLAAAAEALIGRKGGLPAARGVLDAGLSRFPSDRRLRQLDGLYWSRRGGAEQNVEHLHTARAVLEPLLPQGGALATDEETFGILGGVYKRLSELDPVSARDWLWQSHRTYRAGWEQSRRGNDYLGINAATTGLWLGLDTVAAVAEPICDGLSALAARLRADGRALDFWDQVTWAEALLLRRDLGPAGEQYRDAFGRSPDRAPEIGVAAKQARRILDQLGESARAADVLGPWADAGNG